MTEVPPSPFEYPGSAYVLSNGIFTPQLPPLTELKQLSSISPHLHLREFSWIHQSNHGTETFPTRVLARPEAIQVT